MLPLHQPAQERIPYNFWCGLIGDQETVWFFEKKKKHDEDVENVFAKAEATSLLVQHWK